MRKSWIPRLSLPPIICGFFVPFSLNNLKKLSPFFPICAIITALSFGEASELFFCALSFVLLLTPLTTILLLQLDVPSYLLFFSGCHLFCLFLCLSRLLLFNLVERKQGMGDSTIRPLQFGFGLEDGAEQSLVDMRVPTYLLVCV